MSSIIVVHATSGTAAALARNDFRGALRDGALALETDDVLRPALGLVAQLEAQTGPQGWGAATRRLRIYSDLARLDDDPFDRVRADIGMSLVLQAEGAFDAAYTRAESALEDMADLFRALMADNRADLAFGRACLGDREAFAAWMGMVEIPLRRSLQR